MVVIPRVTSSLFLTKQSAVAAHDTIHGLLSAYKAFLGVHELGTCCER